MSEIADLENRLSAALDRIARGLDHIDTGNNGESGADGAEALAAAQSEIAALKAALEAERDDKKALLSEISDLKRLSEPSPLPAATPAATGEDSDIAALKETHAAEIAQLRAAAVAEREAWEGLNSRVVRMRRSNKQLRSNTVALRQAAAEKVVDAEVINQSLQTELDAERAAHELERAETDVILKTLQPLLGEAAEFDELEETV
ncbi:hypothetical protein N6L24_04210 [Cognatishimia sp. SS12]|uniref:hypothetical protein n=1 Tax=Cognatishimia sp. SS12 TaxID=2979465 RepID=UPI00232AB3CA|nr:hypothetical protein [Cognatishimia sp. SS12]MDC0737468.1 hypothetical protein [Cognatishimia sp. SS12]